MVDIIRDLSIRYEKIGDLKPNPRSPRKHSNKQIKRLAKAIQKAGWTCPVAAAPPE